MAAANEKATASVNKRISLGGGTYLYTGTLVFGSEYKTGGMELVNASGERYSLPEKIDYMEIQSAGGYVVEFVNATPPAEGKPGGVIQAWWTGTALKGVLEQVAATTNVSTLLKTVPFVCIGQ